MSTSPVCRTCNDTHVMRPESTGEPWMCTRCPVPCQKCRKGGNGPFCETTPCPCSCHGELTAPPSAPAASPEVMEVLRSLRGYLHSDLDSPCSLTDHITLGNSRQAHEVVAEMTEIIDRALAAALKGKKV